MVKSYHTNLRFSCELILRGLQIGLNSVNGDTLNPLFPIVPVLDQILFVLNIAFFQ